MISKAKLAVSIGIVFVSVMMVQTLGSLVITLTTTVDFEVTIPDKVYTVDEYVPFSITNIHGSFLKYIWFFHDSSENVTTDGSTTSATHAFSTEGQYLVSVFAFTTNDYNYPIDLVRTVLVTVRNTPPTMVLDTNTTTAFESTPIHFSINSLTDPGIDNATISYHWMFGDSVNATGNTIDHAYSNAGTYNVVAYATDSLGQVAMANTSITISGQAPVIHVTTNATTILEGQTVLFNASQTSVAPAEQGSLEYGWSFGNGVLGSGISVTNTYYYPGKYTAVLTVRDRLGASENQSIPIQVINVPPTIKSMSLNHNVISEGQLLIGQAQASDTPSDNPHLLYNWTLDNTSRTGQIATWTFFHPGNTTANLAVSDTSNITTSTTLPVTVLNVPPEASIIGAELNFNLTVIITGDIWHAINIQLLDENNDTALNSTLVRQAGDPWAMSLIFYNVTLDLTHVWRFVTQYTPNSTLTNGANPVSLYLNLTNANTIYYRVFNFTFNVQQPTWYTWVLPLDPFTIGLPVGWLVHYFDPGTSALTILLDHNMTQAFYIPEATFGPQQGTILIRMTLSANLTTPVVLSVVDQYGANASTVYSVDAPLGSQQGYRLSFLPPKIMNLTSTSLQDPNSPIYTAFEDSNVTFTANSIPFYRDTTGLIYHWSFGDGQNFTTKNATVTHYFTYAGLYEVTILIQSNSSNFGIEQGLLLNITVQLPDIQLNQNYGVWTQVGQTTLFDATNTIAVSSEQPVQFYWNFGDGDHYSGFSPKVSHQYFHSGTYQVIVTVVGAEGVNVNKPVTVWVHDPAPQVSLSYKIMGIEGENIIFDPQVSDAAFELPLLQYHWQVGNDQFNQEYINKYFLTGTYTGFLVVSDSEGIFTNSSFTVVVVIPMPRVAILSQYVYGIKPQDFRILFSVAASNLDLGHLQYMIGDGSWQSITTNIINTTIDLSNYQDGLNYTSIQLRDRSSANPPQYIPTITFGDRNGDNILDTNKSILGLSPTSTSTDFDNDGISDYTEITGWNINVLYVNQTAPTTIHVSSDPTKSETNGCLPDNIMYRLGGNPRAYSTAGDGISDCQKYLHGLPLGVAINHATNINGQMYLNYTASDASAIYGVTANISELITGDFLIPYDTNNLGELVSIPNVLTFYNQSNYYLGSCTVNETTGSCSITYSDYQPAVIVKYAGNHIYSSASTTLYPQYDIKTMIQTINLEQNRYFTPDPVESAKKAIFSSYIKDSGAFSNNPATDTYTMIKDTSFTWVSIISFLGITITLHRGYTVISPVSFTSQELQSGTYSPGLVIVRRNYADIVTGNHAENITLTKEEFLTLWLSLKIHPEVDISDPALPTDLHDIDQLARDIITVNTFNSSYLNSRDADELQSVTDMIASVQGRLNNATHMGFPKVLTLNEIIGDAFSYFLSLLLQPFIDLAKNIIQTLLGISIHTDPVQFQFVAWNEVLGTVFGTAQELVSTVVMDASKIVVPVLKLVVDPTVPTGSSPYVGEITVHDFFGNPIKGPITITLYDPLVEAAIKTALSILGVIKSLTQIAINLNLTWIIANVAITNSSIDVSLPAYFSSLRIETSGNPNYFNSSIVVNPLYDILSMVQTLGPSGSDAVRNAKYYIFNRYVTTSGAFQYYNQTDTYNMIDDESQTWQDSQGRTRGYSVVSPVIFSTTELQTETFDNTLVTVQEQYVDSNGQPQTEAYQLSKDIFLTMWLSLKLLTWNGDDNPPTIASLTEINTLAYNFTILFDHDQNYYKNNQNYVASLWSDTKAGLSLAVYKGHISIIYNNNGNNNGGNPLYAVFAVLITIATTIINVVATIIKTLIDNVVNAAVFLLDVWGKLTVDHLGSVNGMVAFVSTFILNKAEQVINTAIDSIAIDINLSILQNLIALKAILSLLSEIPFNAGNPNFENFQPADVIKNTWDVVRVAPDDEQAIKDINEYLLAKQLSSVPIYIAQLCSADDPSIGYHFPYYPTPLSGNTMCEGTWPGAEQMTIPSDVFASTLILHLFHGEVFNYFGGVITKDTVLTDQALTTLLGEFMTDIAAQSLGYATIRPFIAQELATIVSVLPSDWVGANLNVIGIDLIIEAPSYTFFVSSKGVQSGAANSIQRKLLKAYSGLEEAIIILRPILLAVYSLGTNIVYFNWQIASS